MIELIVSFLDLFVCLAVGVLLIIHMNCNWEYSNIELYTKQSLIEQPMTYFNVDNGTYSLTNQHIFSYWEGMNSIRERLCLNYFCTSYKYKSLVPSVPGFDLTIWKNTTFISQNYTYHNYLSLLKQAKPQDEPCDEGYKQCGILDSFNQKLCLLEHETCPLNQIELSKSPTPSDIFTNKDVVNTTLLNDNVTYLHTSNAEINSRVIIGIVLGPRSFCFDFDERKLGPPYYSYDRSSSRGECTSHFGYETDFHYTSLDKQSKFQVYNEIGIISKIQDFINYNYPLKELKNYNLYLYKRNYVGFNLTCLGDRELNEESINVIKKNVALIYRLNVSAAVFVFIQSVVCFLCACVYIGSYDDERFFIYLGGFSISLVVIPLIAISFNLSLTPTNSIYKCTESQMSGQLTESEKLDLILEIISFGLYMLMIFIHLIFMFIISPFGKKICDLIIDCCKERKKKRELAQLGFAREDPQAELKTY